MINVVLSKGENGFGLKFRERKEGGIIVNGAKPNSPASDSQIPTLLGHQLLTVNGQIVESDTREELAVKLRAARDVLLLGIAKEADSSMATNSETIIPSHPVPVSEVPTSQPQHSNYIVEEEKNETSTSRHNCYLQPALTTCTFGRYTLRRY